MNGRQCKKKQLSQFEAAFAGVVESVREEQLVENNQRLQNLATTMEWSMIESECKQLAAQVRSSNYSSCTVCQSTSNQPMMCCPHQLGYGSCTTSLARYRSK